MADEVVGRVGAIHDRLRRQILGLELLPGAVLVPRELAEEHDVSVTPVREALILLQQEGLVHIQPKSNTTVSRISIAFLLDVHFLRVAVETEVTRALAAGCREDVLWKARHALERQAGAASRHDDEAFQIAGGLFHEALFEGAGRGGLHRMLLARASPVARVGRLCPAVPRNEILEAHDTILSGIERKDGTRAVGVMRRHLNPAVNRLDTLRDLFPNYFSP